MQELSIEEFKLNATNESKARIRQFIITNFPLARNQVTLDDNESLVANGIIDSLGVLELVRFIEIEFDMAISEADLLPENFETVTNLVNFVQSKNGNQVAAK